MAASQKYCPNCGTPSTIEAAFCLSCGSKFPSVSPQGGATPSPLAQVIPPVPQAPRGDFITLSCPSCGGKLNVTSDIERFACQFCGHEHIVRRSGGMVSLEPVMQVMKSIDSNINLVGVGVNKLGFSSEKQVAEQSITRLKSEVAEMSNRIAQAENGNAVVIMICSMLGMGFVALLIVSIAKSWSGWLVLLFLGLTGLMIWGIVAITKDNSWKKKMQDELAVKQAELERNYEIVRK